MIKLLLIVALYFVTNIPYVTGNYWSEWSRWSECSRTCDGGATYQTRKCIRSRRYKFKCLGNGIRYSTCNNKPCPAGQPDFRSEQCAAYDETSYSGRIFRWLPYHDKKDQCSLSCIAEGTKMVAILAPKVLDGTRCNTHSLNMCINGKCMTVGCDHKLSSKVKMDDCGVCGGNDSCSHGNRGEAGRYRWIHTGYGSCSVSCGIGIRERRLLCFDTYRGKVMDTTYCDNIIRPVLTQQSCNTEPCPPEWRVGPWQNCTRDCGGGVSWRIVTCVQTYKDGTQQLSRDSFCTNRRPSSRKSCNGFICPTWYAGDWSMCSASCSTGLQKREVICRHIGDTFCRAGDKPRTVKNCTTGIPCFTLNGDIQERNVGALHVSPFSQPQGDEAFTKETLKQPRFVTTTWDSCSASCGEGTRFRYVRCQVFLDFMDEFMDLPDGDCGARSPGEGYVENNTAVCVKYRGCNIGNCKITEVKPEEYEKCEVDPCYDQYKWEPDGVTSCSRSCLGGIQETILKCVHKETGVTADEEFCLEAPHVQTERRVCNDRPCPQRWELGSFGECSQTCGSGSRSRSVKCIQEYAQGPNILTLPDFMCSQPVPSREDKCNTHDCPANWALGNWSECSVTCGLGVLSRRPLCQLIRDGKIVNVSRSYCDITLKPETEKTCTMTDCQEPKLKAKKIQFYQLNKIKRLKLTIGMEASVLPDTNIILKCPHVGLDRQKITWFKNGYKFRRSKRAKVARSGALRIRNAMPGRDDAVYSCFIGGLEANVTIKFSSSFDVLQATVLRERYIKGARPQPENLMVNENVLHMDPVDRKHKSLHLIATDWSMCSMTCGGGLQSRNTSCEIITNDYYEVLPNKDCFKHLSDPPSLIQSCNVAPCVKWTSGPWSECSDAECVRYQYAIQRRNVSCVNEFNNTVTNDSYCSGLKFPPDNIKDCYNTNCSAKWTTSKWSECTADCDEKGFKTRTLNCIWVNNGQMAPRGSCDRMSPPTLTRKCRGPPCTEVVCEDESDHCSIVKTMNMCHYSDFINRCCYTCTADYIYDDYGDAADDDTKGDADDDTIKEDNDALSSR